MLRIIFRRARGDMDMGHGWRGWCAPETRRLVVDGDASCACKEKGAGGSGRGVGWCQIESVTGWTPQNHTFLKSGSATKETHYSMMETAEDG